MYSSTFAFKLSNLIGLSKLEKLLFASNRESDLVDGGLDLVGSMVGAWIRYQIGLGGFY